MKACLIAIAAAILCAAMPAHAQKWVYGTYIDRNYWRMAFDQASVRKTGYNRYGVTAFAISLRQSGVGRWAQIDLVCPTLDTAGFFVGGSATVTSWKTYDKAGEHIRSGTLEGNAWIDEDGEGDKLFSSLSTGICPEVIAKLRIGWAAIDEPFPFVRMQADAARKRREALMDSLTKTYARHIENKRIDVVRNGELLHPTRVAVANCQTVMSFTDRPDLVTDWLWMSKASLTQKGRDFTMAFGGIGTSIVYHATEGEMRSINNSDAALRSEPELKYVTDFTKIVGNLCVP